MKIVKNKLPLLLAYTFISIVMLSVTSIINNRVQESWFAIISFLLILHMFFTLFFIRILKIRLISLTAFFIFLSYVFHFGQIFLHGFFPDYKFRIFEIRNVVSLNDYKTATLFSLLIINCVVLGVGFQSLLVRKELEKCRVNVLNKVNFKIGIILIMIGVPIRVSSDLAKIKVATSGNYLDVFQMNNSSVIQILGYLMFVGITIISLEYSKLNKNRAKAIVITTIVYLVITMVYGGRGEQITILLFFFYIYFTEFERLSFKYLLFLLIVSQFLLKMLNGIFMLRNFGSISLEQIKEIIHLEAQTSPLLNTIEEFGSTQYTVILTVSKVRETNKLNFGINYFASIITSLVINIKGILGSYLELNHFAKSLGVSGIGGSYIAELYINFRYLSVVLAVFMGFFIEKFSRRLNEYLNRMDSLKVAMCMPVFTDLIWWVRNAFGRWIRPFILIYITIYILKKIVNELNYNLNEEDINE